MTLGASIRAGMRPMTTERLQLRPLVVEDITPAYVEALNDPDIVRWTEARHTQWNRQRVARFIEESNVDGVSTLLGIFLKASGRHIGNIRLFNRHAVHRRAELSFIIFDKRQWSNGYATEAVRAVTTHAFEVLGLHRIHADYHEPNIASARVFEKAGFDVEGVFKGHFAQGGGYVNSVRVAKMNPQEVHSAEPQPRNTALIPSAGPSMTEREVRLVTEAARIGWYTNMNLYLERFERSCADYTGMRYCLATSSCTAALHLALLALGIGPGDEVIVPDITWVASGASICYTGATPVFADMDRDSWCLDPEAFERAITRRTKAVMVVGLAGNLPDMDAMRAIAGRHGIPMLEDAAESIGAEYKGKRAGTFGRLGALSFNGTKLLVTGEGGMLVTNERALSERVKRLRNHGVDQEREGKYYWSYHLGYKYKMTNMQAAMGLAQLERIDELVAMRRQIFSWYAERLQGVEGLRLNQAGPRVKSTFWLVTAMVDPSYKLKKEALVNRLVEQRIAGRPFFYPLSSMPTFAPYCRGKRMSRINPVSYALSPYGVCLPSAASLTESDVDYVCEQFLAILRKRTTGRSVSRDGRRQAQRPLARMRPQMVSTG